ncbi:MAG: Peptide methionine sulfoxide reductase MsrB (EC [uncultured Sulfurovum sp.]|uniref:peptide-methionine (R)-S-oxide reductase n=1 Tax=uncultured Sulfurovum sp. TaxID=269237 RepID=A0A6S6SBI2_9BACT|nr:MAG: Peptide methionine sulfoxide reductase MsrB (EC [uncultured Sulfurovum sp.]
MAYNELTEEEKNIILNKGTEKSFAGKYWNHYEEGTYTCRQCNAELFSSDTKFDSFTGWPSFDEAFEGSVTEVPDADGRRIEVICSNCKGHLGHVFKGEGITETSTRHCINSVSLGFKDKE